MGASSLFTLGGMNFLLFLNRTFVMHTNFVAEILTDLSLTCSLSLVATMEVETLREENLVRSVRGGRRCV